MLLIQIEHGSFEEYRMSFGLEEDLTADIARRFRQIGPSAAGSFLHRVSGPAATAA